MAVVPMATNWGSVLGISLMCLCRNGCVEVICHIPEATSLSRKSMLAKVAGTARRDNPISRVLVDFICKKYHTTACKETAC